MYVDLSDSYDANLYRKEAAMNQIIALDFEGSRQMTLHEFFNIQEVSPLQVAGD